MTWRVDQTDALDWLKDQPEQSIDLVFGSPPYVAARLYLEDGKNLGIARKVDAWVEWMVEIYTASLRACKGLVAFVVEGNTKNFRYDCAPILLAAELCRRGVTLRKPPIYHRRGIPGSGGPDWWKNDWEFIICATNGGRLPWSEPTACGQKPKWQPGGAMSYRGVDGQRKTAKASLGRNMANGIPGTTKGACVGRRVARGKTLDGKLLTEDAYLPPKIANPGNVLSVKVGGGLMGNKICHKNEAPFPEALAERFIRSFCPPDGIVCDPFSGSGTTGAVAVRHCRNFIGCDLRQSQVDLSRTRIATETPMQLFESEALTSNV